LRSVPAAGISETFDPNFEHGLDDARGERASALDLMVHAERRDPGIEMGDVEVHGSNRGQPRSNGRGTPR
jgi:hypothetical protein